MRLPVFLVLTLGVTLAVGLLSAIGGAGLWASLGRAIAVLVALQVIYFVFLMIAARNAKPTKTGDNGN
jgi:hypothetical protein